MTFEDLDYAHYGPDTGNATNLMIDIAIQLTNASFIEGTVCEVIALYPGSVIAAVEVTIPDSTSEEDIDALLETYTTNTSSLFNSAFIELYGTPTVRIVSRPGDASPAEPPRDELADDLVDDGDGGVNLVIVIVPIVVGVAMIIGFIAAFVVCSSRARALRNVSLLHDF